MAKQTRTGKSVAAPTVDQLAEQNARDSEILRLALVERLNGTQIAERLGINRSTVTRAHDRMWQRYQAPMVEKLRARHQATIDLMIGAYLPKALAGDDKAALVVWRYLDREAKLHALDAIRQQEVRHEFAIPETAEERRAQLELVIGGAMRAINEAATQDETADETGT